MQCMVTAELLSNIADAIRDVTGESRKYDLNEICSIVENLERRNTVITEERLASEYFNNVVSYIGSYTFRGYTRLITAGFENVERVERYAFSSCTSMETISLPEVSFIGSYAFAMCYSLNSLYTPKLDYIGDYAFVQCSSLESLNAPRVSTIGS